MFCFRAPNITIAELSFVNLVFGYAYCTTGKKQVKNCVVSQWSSSVIVTHILYTGDFQNVYMGETIADSNKKKKTYIHVGLGKGEYKS